jgi:hypothetical protein
MKVLLQASDGPVLLHFESQPQGIRDGYPNFLQSSCDSHWQAWQFPLCQAQVVTSYASDSSGSHPKPLASYELCRLLWSDGGNRFHEESTAMQGILLFHAASDGDTVTVSTVLSSAGSQSLINYQHAKNGHMPLLCAASLRRTQWACGRHEAAA